MAPVTHVVLVSWRAGEAGRAEDLIRPRVAAFPTMIPGVLDVVEGHSSSPEGLEGGYDYGLVVTFASAQARDTYLDHPEHRPVAEVIGASSQRVVVFDI